MEKYSQERSREPKNLKNDLFDQPRKGGLALLHDLHDLWLLTQEVQLCWTVIHQAALALRDEDLKAACEYCSARTKRQTNGSLAASSKPLRKR